MKRRKRRDLLDYEVGFEDMSDPEYDSRSCTFCGDVMFNEDGLWVCCGCGCDADEDDEEDYE